MDILDAMFAVFESISTWFIGAVQSVSTLFYTPGVDGSAGSLTFVGVLAVTSLGISMVTWLVATIRSYLQLHA